MAPGDPSVYVQLTGPARAQVGLDVVSFVPDKRFQLLAYLAYHNDWIGRERLAFLFWPDTDTATSRQNLRGLLQRVRRLRWKPSIEATTHHVRWEVDSDVRRYREAVDRRDVDGALSAHHGSLLTRLEGGGGNEFADWLEIEREKLHGDWRSLVLQRAEELGKEHFQVASGLLERLAAIDPLDEDAVRLHLAVAASAGRFEEARRAYRTFEMRLQREMGLRPTSATVAAFEALADGARGVVHMPAEAPAEPGRAIRRGPSLPLAATSFVDRREDLARAQEAILDPACRLLTLVGEGGVGKTRLALQLATRVVPDFEAGAVMVSLDTLASSGGVPAAIATALDLPGGSAEGALERVVSALTNRPMLLVMDNFEHVIDEVRSVATLLERCPRLKVLATSRERLRLAGEWVFPVEGLPYPGGDVDPATAMSFDAATLFMERARQVRPRFEVSAEDMSALMQLCAMTGGLPLALELAAVWVRVLPLPDIVDEVGRNLDLLTTDVRDVPERHRSIRATFEHSWALLTEAERTVMSGLSVFHAPFPHEAAAYVAGASPAAVAALVDKSLMAFNRDGRLELHRLLAEFARLKLDERPQERSRVEARHAGYVLRFLRERTDRARGPTPGSALSEIHRELPEILGAARTAAARGRAEDLISVMRLLAIDTAYFTARGFVPEALELLRRAAEAAAERGDAASHDLFGRLGDAFATHRNEPTKALEAYEVASELARRAGHASRQAIFRSMCGVMRSRTGDDSGAEDLDVALAMARSDGDDLGLSTVLEHRAYVLASAGRWPEAETLYQESLRVVDRLEAHHGAEPYELNRRRFFALINLGEAELHLNQFEASLAARERALRIAEASGNPIWIAHALHEMGEMHGSVGNDVVARELLVRALQLYRDNSVTAHIERLTSFMTDKGYGVPSQEP